MIDGGDSCTMVSVLNATGLHLKMMKMVNFNLCLFCHNKK